MGYSPLMGTVDLNQSNPDHITLVQTSRLSITITSDALLPQSILLEDRSAIPTIEIQAGYADPVGVSVPVTRRWVRLYLSRLDGTTDLTYFL
jgi:hypothetical protein